MRLGDRLRANRCLSNVLHIKLPRHDYNETAQQTLCVCTFLCCHSPAPFKEKMVDSNICIQTFKQSLHSLQLWNWRAFQKLRLQTSEDITMHPTSSTYLDNNYLSFSSEGKLRWNLKLARYDFWFYRSGLNRFSRPNRWMDGQRKVVKKTWSAQCHKLPCAVTMLSTP